MYVYMYVCVCMYTHPFSKLLLVSCLYYVLHHTSLFLSHLLICTPPPPQTHGYTRTYPICSLNPDDDPLCALLMIDFYAIRAEDYTFLQQMYLEWEVCLHVCASGGWEGWEGDVHVGGYMYQWVFVCMRGMCVCVWKGV